jgi:uncharacterized protein YggU (UPF0235/DUF167 family)
MPSKNQHAFNNGQFGAAIAVRVNPYSNVDEIIGVKKDGFILVNLKEGYSHEEVNEKLLSLLAQALTVKKEQLEIVSGNFAMDKLVIVLGKDSGYVQGKILKYIH